MVIVKQVNGDKKGMRDFLELPYSLYKNDKNWCPPLRFERKEFFSKKNPFMKHSEVGFFVAYKDNQPIGRVTAHRDGIYDDFYNTRQGFFGFYESIEDDKVSGELMNSCENWIKSRSTKSSSPKSNGRSRRWKHGAKPHGTRLRPLRNVSTL
ncbi:MAG: hypothetical protein IIB46_04955 [Nitrospinae bacterium]|nr:hypothetical protein [Nitrospinota bacterium]